jgi:hypothetical protein
MAYEKEWPKQKRNCIYDNFYFVTGVTIKDRVHNEKTEEKS